MLIITIRTDKPEAELGLYEDNEKLSNHTWLAHRELAETILIKIKALLDEQQKTLEDIEGLVAFKGPGSFTGLRIGLSVANALASGLEVPIVCSSGEDWLKAGLARIRKGENEQIALPEYGAPPHITLPKH